MQSRHVTIIENMIVIKKIVRNALFYNCKLLWCNYNVRNKLVQANYYIRYVKFDVLYETDGVNYHLESRVISLNDCE